MEDAIEIFLEHLRQKEAEEISSYAMQLYAYIPDLRDLMQTP